MSRAKRWLFLTHRWIGVAMAVPMLLWFVSGVVMMYVGYPKLTDAERLAALPPLTADACCAPLGTVLAAAGATGPVRELRLTSVAGRPAWIVPHGRTGSAGRGAAPVAIDARDAGPIGSVDAAFAQASAVAFAGRSTARAEHPEPAATSVERIVEDAWTHSRALDDHRPLYRVALDDAAGTQLYVSSSTGEVVRDSTRRERAWNWLGAWLHWLYVFRGGPLDAWWHDLVVALSVIGTVAVATGLVVGTMRWRVRGRYASGARTPYRRGTMRWHHVAGLLFALTTLTWIVSGLASMNPWKVFDSGAPPLNQRAYAGTALDAAHLTAPAAQPASILARLPHGFAARELRYVAIGGRVYAVAFDAAGGTRLVPADDEGAGAMAMLPLSGLTATAARLVPGARIVSSQTVTRHDFWWVARAPHTMLGHVERRLPVLRVRFDDAYGTWVHVDPFTGATSRLDARGRVKRCVFALLHSWDWPALLAAPPAWDALLIAASLGGAVLAASGVAIGWRRLRRAVPRPDPFRGGLKAAGNSSSLEAAGADARGVLPPGSPVEIDR